MTLEATPLRLDTTGQHLGGPVLGPHDNSQPVAAAVRGCVAQLALIAGH